MAAQSGALHTDTTGAKTSAEYGDPGDGSTEWYLYMRVADGGNATEGTKADAAVTSPSSSGSIVALLKGILTGTNVFGVVKTNANSTAYEASRVVKASAGRLYGVRGFNSLSTPQWIHLYNATALPADGGTPVHVHYVAGSANFSIDFGPVGRQFSTGIVVGNSTTGPTKTLGAANCWFDAQYE